MIETFRLVADYLLIDSFSFMLSMRLVAEARPRFDEFFRVYFGGSYFLRLYGVFG